MALNQNFILESQYFEDLKNLHIEVGKSVNKLMLQSNFSPDKETLIEIKRITDKGTKKKSQLVNSIRVKPEKDLFTCTLIFNLADQQSLLKILKKIGIDVEKTDVRTFANSLTFDELKALPGIQPIHVRRLKEMVETAGLTFKEEQKN
jgi:hypothetical protein